MQKIAPRGCSGGIPPARDGLAALFEDPGEESSDPLEEPSVFGLIRTLRRRRLNHRIEWNLTSRRFLHRQVFGRLHGCRRHCSRVVLRGKYERSINLHMHIVRFGRRKWRRLWSVR